MSGNLRILHGSNHIESCAAILVSARSISSVFKLDVDVQYSSFIKDDFLLWAG